MGRKYSPKSYGIAVSLCMIFGMLGIHHFYTGRYLLGIFDFGLFVVSTICFFVGLATQNWSMTIAGIIGLLLDFAHTIFVTVRLLIGEETDGQGQIITYKESGVR